MISRDMEGAKRGFVERLLNELNPQTDQDRRIIESRYYEEVGEIMETAKIKKYVPLIAYRNVRSFFNGNGNEKDLSGKTE